MLTSRNIITSLVQRISKLTGHEVKVSDNQPYTIKVDGRTELTYDYEEDVISSLQGIETALCAMK